MQGIQITCRANHFHVRLLLSICSLVAMSSYLLLRNNFRVSRTTPTSSSGLLAIGETHHGAHGFFHKDDSSAPGNGVLPNLLFVGAQKSGSTALSQWIFNHEGVCGAGDSPPHHTKEVHFFDHEEKYLKGLTAYNSLFGHCENASLVLDATPNYLSFAGRVREIYDAAGGMHARNLKIIVTLRDPVARELSIYNHIAYQARTEKTKGWWHRVVTKDDGSIMTFSEYVDEVTLPSIESKRSFSLYAHHLREWMNKFDRNQILVLSYDELKQDPNTLLARVSQFVGFEEGRGAGAEKPQLPQDANAKNSKEKVVLPPCKDQKRIVSVLAAENDALYDLLREQPGPPMEQRPFPKFSVSNCSSDDL